MKILFISLGCDKNLVDTEVMLGLLASKGYEMTDDEQEADIIVINTCCFIHDAKEESIQNILEMAELKKELDKVYNDCISLDLNYDGTKVDENGKPEPEYFTKEEKSQINEAYEDAVKVLRNSKSTAAESYQAQQEAIKAIQQIQKTTTEAHETILAAFRENLNKLPDDVSLITKSVESTVTIHMREREARRA